MDTRNDRRAFLRLAVAGAGPAIGSTSGQEKPPAQAERARTLGREYMTKYGNCAQCTIAALQDSLEIAPKNEAVFLAGTGLHGGASATGNASCGAFTGAGMVIGSLRGRSREKLADRDAAALAGKLVRELSGKFEQTYGSVVCKDVRAKAEKNCPEVVSRAADWAAEILLAQFPAGHGRKS
ncbi:MAG: C_GCAxxG_C_C family protein [Acidobacteria bacterium]|nr:C_GCAxxG_C_C family protein [Acidobacteriota bacterium]